MRPAHWLPHLRVAPHHLIRWGPQPAPVCVGRTCQPTQHLHLAHQQLGQVRNLKFFCSLHICLAVFCIWWKALKVLSHVIHH